MKKLLLCSLLATRIFAFASTQTDVDNANYLAWQNIITKQSNAAGYRLNDTITRAEVVGIALKIKWVALPDNYHCKNYFSDVKYNVNNNWICGAVELGADRWLVSRTNKAFRPQDKITRAEALSIISRAANIEMVDDDKCNSLIWESLPYYDDFSQNTPKWIKKIYCSLLQYNIYFPGLDISYPTRPIDTQTIWIEGVNAPAKRWEIMATIRDTLRFKKYKWYFNSINIPMASIIGSHSFIIAATVEQEENEKLVYDSISSGNINISSLNKKISESSILHPFNPFATFIEGEKVIAVKEFPKNCISFLYGKPFTDYETWVDQMTASVETICASDKFFNTEFDLIYKTFQGLDIFNAKIDVNKYKTVVESKYGNNLTYNKLSDYIFEQISWDFQNNTHF